MIAADLALALDPVRLAERAGMTPDPWQAGVLRSQDRQTILLCSRQSGKSTVSAVMAVHEAVYRDAALVLVLSPSLRQSQELFRKALDVYHALGHVAPPSAETKLTLELSNSSRIVSLPGKESTIRGFSGVSLLIVDEAARVDDALYGACRPMLAVSAGRIVLLSTPFGRRGFFYRAWADGGPDWQRVKVTADQVPRIDPSWLAAERGRVGSFVFDQEYGCEFVDTDAQFFSSAIVDRAVSAEVERLVFPFATGEVA
jgi:phage FluMu gp28-like protein